jgi:hypothetical protein
MTSYYPIAELPPHVWTVHRLVSRDARTLREGDEINEAMVKSDPNNVQDKADLANTNMTMGIALYVMRSLQQALKFERRADAIYRDVELQDPDDEGNRVDHATALIYAGRTEARLTPNEISAPGP